MSAAVEVDELMEALLGWTRSIPAQDAARFPRSQPFDSKRSTLSSDFDALARGEAPTLPGLAQRLESMARGGLGAAAIQMRDAMDQADENDAPDGDGVEE